MLSELIDASSWTHEQWLAIIILVFIVLTAVMLLHRILKLFRLSRRTQYRPNLRPLRRSRHSEQATDESKND